ncbi:Mitochondrial import inner membrane translocase subunit Tim23 isoform 1 [Schistosoma japonicum]|uniref:Mitochondrial import inner membrane translocase subunit Tim23 isoform 1 n=1 Tax=Schistosoma japonicum TaxID=6182 RepID=A0A4Z2CPQ4_SCHJA|nr:Mitochondrial import inner membrane translocase subunit Tim23 [Schistosoma japonicum]KAH8865420.1 Mitochondrial import inner membrane translocase subunit Tim23 [Schistosoma japonicum]KAH8865422.1 Mitochondrial import inner membrane translocase subunit Tim23 [Schistosoma japonicum]KAH8865423.1 Mitochondrial import inner membrane translocase subunit Tim23 [Schistosoma japonicum]TNN06231.1 Mitochondrial import inner membrane translocase subunit Tim23 isoform 1 [Schistosoma japonicum]
MTSANFDDRNIFVSPFLNFDPSILISNPEEQFIFPEGEKRRGRFERSFSEIGAMVIGGASVGGIKGLYSSLKDSELKNLPTLSVRRTQMLNHMTKSGATLAQTTGSIGLIYALADFLIHKLRRGADDEINTITAATATGLVYASPGKRIHNFLSQSIVDRCFPYVRIAHSLIIFIF